jgi:ketosteroid isomerase-like protein
MITERHAPESAIRELIERWAAAVRGGDLDRVLADPPATS